MEIPRLYSISILFLAIVMLSVLCFACLIYGVDPVSSDRCAVIAKLHMNIDGGAVLFMDRAVSSALSRKCILIIEIDSYGGYVAAADKIVHRVIDSGVECYSWIPPGAKAVSAAAMVALSCNAIYMGPGSSIGAAKPIPSDEKTVEYVASRFRALAEKLFHGNKTLVRIAESMVRNSTSLSCDEAVSIGFAEYASNLSEVLRELDIVNMYTLEPNLWEKLISLISDPLIASIMFSIGVFLIVMEILVTGFQGYAIAGALLIAFSLYGMTIVPPDILSLILLICGAILLVVEIHSGSHGVFGVPGAILMIIGLAVLFTTKPPETITAEVLALTGGLLSLAGFTVFIAFKAARVLAIKRPRYEETLINSIGIAKTDIYETKPGVVYVRGEDWTAYSVKGRIEAGSRVRIVRVEGLKLYVEKVEEDTQ